MKQLLDIINQYQQQNQFSGQIIVARKKNIVYSYTAGYADFANKQQFSEQTIFPIASISKQFMATVILKLIESRQIDIEDPISAHLKVDHKIWSGNMPLWANNITIHQLLANCSGLVNYVMEAIFHPDAWQEMDNANGQDITRLIVEKINFMPLLFVPGSQFAYSNTNYLLLGEIAQEVIKSQSLPTWVQNNIFNPLEMTKTIWPDLEQELAYIRNIYAQTNLPKRYTTNYHDVTSEPELVVSHGFNVPCGGAGSMFSTAKDLLTWNNALYSGKIISTILLQQMTTVHQHIDNDPSLGKVSYGYGIMIDKIEGQTIYRHSGHFNGIRTQLSYDPNNEISVVLLTNFSPSYAQDFSFVSMQDKEQVDLVSQLHLAILNHY